MIRSAKQHQRNLGWEAKKSVFSPDTQGRAQGEQDGATPLGTSIGQIALEVLGCTLHPTRHPWFVPGRVPFGTEQRIKLLEGKLKGLLPIQYGPL